MTYARARLWLGITGVGSLVTLSSIALLSGIPQELLSANERFGFREILQLFSVTGLFMLWLMPLDLLGGFLLPRRSEIEVVATIKNSICFGCPNRVKTHFTTAERRRTPVVGHPRSAIAIPNSFTVSQMFWCSHHLEKLETKDI